MRLLYSRNSWSAWDEKVAMLFVPGLAAVFVAVVIGLVAFGNPIVVRSAAAERVQTAAKTPRLHESKKATVRFDMLVRDDFFAGMFEGNQARFERALKFTENTVTKDPKNGDAWVWLGSAHLYQSSQAYTQGKATEGKNLWDRGLAEMDKGVALDPNDVGVHIGRGAPLLGAASSGYDPNNPLDRKLLRKAVGDYEFALAKQTPDFGKIGLHSRGELLFGLASGWSLLGNSAKARAYLNLVVKDCPNSRYEMEARSWLAKKPLGVVEHACIGCHID